jgi:uncharacterized protein (DUF2235 family)
MASIYTGKTAPLDGRRKLSGREALQRAKAMACIRSTRSTECHGQVFAGFFFDGTGNNDKWIEKGHTFTQRARNKHSNIARLWDVHLEKPREGFFRFYVPGVGTPFDAIGDTTACVTDIAGSGFAYMGANRICWAITSLLGAVHHYLTGNEILPADELRTLVALMSSEMLTLPVTPTESILRWRMLTGLRQKIANVVEANPRKIRQINVSIFGFSRGAAEARACAHWLHQIFEDESGAFEIASIPIRIGFMGIFDTVAAVGVGDITPVTFGHMAWASGTQSIHPVVEECAHFIALHEQRASFPLESATGRGNVGYPGMHSDVGGGYWPGEQGKSMASWGASPHLSQIPLMDMHFAALKAGVPLLTIEEISAMPELLDSFATDEKVLRLYNKWLETNAIPAGTVTEFTQAHTNQYLRWRGSLHVPGQPRLDSKRFFKESIGADTTDLAEADKNLGIMLRAWQERQAANATVRGRVTEIAKEIVHVLAPGGRLFTDGGKDPLSSYEARFLAVMTKGDLPPQASIGLFEEYVHDSRAGFRVASYHEPEWLTGGYARYRHVFSQQLPDERPYIWANESLKAVKAAAGATVDFFQKLYSYNLETYETARGKIGEGVDRAKQNAVAVGRTLEDSVSRKTSEAKSRANEAMRLYDSAQKKILLKYASAEAELRRQLVERWRQLEKGFDSEF